MQKIKDWYVPKTQNKQDEFLMSHYILYGDFNKVKKI